MGLAEEFEAYKATQQQSREYNLEQDFAKYKRDMAQGGSIRQAPKEAPFSIGGLAGGVGVGLATGNPYAAIVGAAGGEAVQQLVEHALGSPNAPESTGEAAQRIAQEAASMGVGEGLGRGVVFLADKLGRPLVGHIKPEAVAAEHFLQGKTKTPVFMPAEATDTRILDVLHNVAEYSILGGGAIKEFKHNRDQFFHRLADDIVNRYGKQMTDIEIGRAVVDSAKRNFEAARMPAKMIYGAIDRMAAPKFLDVPARMKVRRFEGGGGQPAANALKEQDVYGESLAEFLASKGGVKDQGGEVSRFEMKAKPFKKKLIKDDGMDLDTAAALAEEAGYIQERNINTLLNALESESRGKPVFSPMNARPGMEDELFEQAFNTKVAFQDIQVGDKLQRLKVMTTTQERQISGTKIDLAPMQADLAEMSKIAKQSGGLADREMGNTLLAFIQNKPDVVSYPVAKAIRTEIRTLRDTLKNSLETKNAPAIGKADLIYGKLTERIRTGLNEDDPFLAEMWDQANAIEAGANQTFNNKLIRRLTKEADDRGGGKPGSVADAVWNASKDNVSVINKVRNAVDWPDWQKMQRWELEQAIARSSDDGVINARKLESHFFGPNGVGEKAVEAGFDKATVTELKGLTNAMKLSQERQGEGTGRMLVQLTQGGALMNLAAGLAGELGIIDYDPDIRNYLGSAGIVLAPPLLAKIMTHPQGIKWLTEGFSTPVKGKATVALAGRLLQAAFPRPDLPRQEPARLTTSITPMPLEQ